MKLIIVMLAVCLVGCAKKKDCYVCYTLNTYTNEKGPDERFCGWDATDASVYASKQKENNTFTIGGTKYYRLAMCRIE